MLIYDRLICICRPTTPPSFLLSLSGNSFLIRYNNTRRPIPFMDNSEIIGPIFFCFLFSNVSNGDRGTAARGKQNTKNYGAMLNNLGKSCWLHVPYSRRCVVKIDQLLWPCAAQPATFGASTIVFRKRSAAARTHNIFIPFSFFFLSWKFIII